MKIRTLTILSGCAAAALHAHAFGGAILGTAQPVAALDDSTVTHTGSTGMTGNRGAWPITANADFPPGITYALMNVIDAIAQPAQSDARTAFASLAGVASSMNRTRQGLGEMTLTAGTNTFESTAQLTGALTLGPETAFLGTMVADASVITLTTGATTLDGLAMAVHDSLPRAITSIQVTPVISAPAPPAAAMGLAGCGAMCLTRRRRATLSGN